MEVRRNYYSEEQKLLRLLKEESEREYMAMSDEERQEDERLMRQRLESLYERVKEEKRHIRRVLDIHKQEMFHIMVQAAIVWSKCVAADLLADVSEQLCGTIRFKADFFLINSETPTGYRSYLLELMQKADEVSFYVNENVVVMEFVFRLYEEMVVEVEHMNGG